MTTRSRLLFCFVLLGIVLGSVENADATPITWTYEGSVIGGFPQPPVIPVGTPVTFTVTADPARNLLAGSPFCPDSMGAYLATVHATMAGVGYTVNAAFEINGNPLGCPFPGSSFPGTALREISESTDQGFSYGPPSPQNPTIAYIPQLFFGNNPSSPELLMPFPTFEIALFVLPAPFPSIPPEMEISGRLAPAPVPEPASGTLLALGFAAAALAKRLRRPRPGGHGQEAE
jgi:PEP-CTERM motif